MRPPVMMQQPPSQRPPPPHHQYMPQPGHPPEPLGSSGPPFHPPAARPPLGGPTGPPLGGYPGYPSGVPTGGPAPSPVPASAPQQSGPGRPDEGPEFESSELQSKEAAAWTAHKATTGQVQMPCRQRLRALAGLQSGLQHKLAGRIHVHAVQLRLHEPEASAPGQGCPRQLLACLMMPAWGLPAHLNKLWIFCTLAANKPAGWLAGGSEPQSTYMVVAGVLLQYADQRVVLDQA